MRTYPNANWAVYDVSMRVLHEGHQVSPRGMRTLELLHEVFTIEDPADCVPDGINRPKFSAAMLALEAVQNVAGRQAPELFQRIAPASSKFAMLVYGARLGPQLRKIEAMLRDDPESRQAVATIWHEGLLDDPAGASNHCTVALTFMLRDGRLHLLADMRSNDAFWGLTYDIPQFTQVQATMANVLGVGLGRYTHVASSMHLYDRHWDVVAQNFMEPKYDDGHRLLGFTGEDWHEAAARAEDVLSGRELGGATASEQWFVDALAPYGPDGR